jgi:hypothetical protein
METIVSIKELKIHLKNKLSEKEMKKAEKAFNDLIEKNQITLTGNLFVVFEEMAKADELTRVQVLETFEAPPKNSKQTIDRLYRASQILGINRRTY